MLVLSKFTGGCHSIEMRGTLLSFGRRSYRFQFSFLFIVFNIHPSSREGSRKNNHFSVYFCYYSWPFEHMFEPNVEIITVLAGGFSAHVTLAIDIM